LSAEQPGGTTQLGQLRPVDSGGGAATGGFAAGVPGAARQRHDAQLETKLLSGPWLTRSECAGHSQLRATASCAVAAVQSAQWCVPPPKLMLASCSFDSVEALTLEVWALLRAQ